MELSKCAICGEKGTSKTLVNIGKKGLLTLVNASKLRSDEKWQIFESVSSLSVHKDCRKKYTHPTNIKKEQNTCSDLEVPHCSKSVLRSASNQCFDFKSQCLFCAEVLNAKQDNFRVVSTICFKDSIDKQAEERNDNWGREVHKRICTEIDLVAAEARYHVSCYWKFKKPQTNQKPGRPKNYTMEAAFDNICLDIENDLENCQFSIKEIHEKLIISLPPDIEPWSEKHLKSKLIEKYGNNIVISKLPGKHSVLCFRDSCEKFIIEEWYKQKNSTPQEERTKILKTAAQILRQDIRSMACETKEYPSLEEIQSGGKNAVPESLNEFLNELIGTNRQKSSTYQTKITALQNFIISLVRVKSFVSPVMFGLGVQLHKKYGSRYLIDLLSALGVCVSYSECLQFENSATQNYTDQISDQCLLQFVFDNVDFNIRTLDGFGTFHAMGGIMCVSPGNALTCSSIPRGQGRSPANVKGKFGHIPIQSYSRSSKLGLSKISMEPLELDVNIPGEKLALALETLWISRKFYKTGLNPSWSGYMSTVEYEGLKTNSSILPLPFINLDPGNMSTIYTSLLFAAEKCKKYGKTCIITFDQPLFLKAVDIVESSNPNHILSSVIIRLGGFHTLMSFLGSLGNLMSGTGIEELWQTVYAKNTIIHMISGHAYARALRAHFLSHHALSTLIFKNFSLEEAEIETLGNLYDNPITENIENDETLAAISKKWLKEVEKISNKSRTGQLWILYWKMVYLIKLYVRAEREGNWSLHLHCTKRMIPIFYATGHNNYAKCAHLYVMQMKKLEIINPDEYNKFAIQGMFAIKRTDAFWCGTWSDMVIEQHLMRTIKTQGGLTQGRGFKETTLARWIASMAPCSSVSNMLEDFSGVRSCSSEQHVELRHSRQQRDENDLNKFLEWLETYNPFECEQFISLYSQVVAHDTVNCDKAQPVGEKILNENFGKKYTDIKCVKKRQVVTFAQINNTVVVNKREVVINPMQLFNRIVCSNKSPEQLKNCFSYELAPYPLSLFKDGQLRGGTKSQLLKEFDSILPPGQHTPNSFNNSVYVLDGGLVLHKVVWQKPATYREICIQYVNYAVHSYGKNCVVIFDGYDETNFSTKDQLQKLRSKHSRVVDLINLDTAVSCTQEEFLRNNQNKKKIISLLKSFFQRAGVTVFQSDRDADVLVCLTAIELCSKHEFVFLVSEDTDIMVLALHHCKKSNLYLLRPGKAGTNDRITNISELQNCLGPAKEKILFLHAISGCDTTSFLFKKSKKACLSVLKKNPQLFQALTSFYAKDASKPKVLEAGLEFLLKVYNAKTTSSLNELRYFMYHRITSRQVLSGQLNLAVLPPTEKAAEQHLLRVYYQVQEWLGNRLDPTAWGWIKSGNGDLIPNKTKQEIAPPDLLNQIFCNCKESACGRNCSCKKLGIKCSPKCGNCNGITCTNAVFEIEEEEMIDF